MCAAYFGRWTRPQTRSELNVAAAARAEYVARAITAERDQGLGRWTRREGELQAALSNWPSLFEVLDRECVLQHPNDAVRRAHIGEACEASRAAAHALSYTKGVQKGFGNELDALAVDAAGRILVIEAKDGADCVGVGWTPAQVSVYLELLGRWADESANAADDLEAMLAQRRQLGFPSSAAFVRRPLQLVPVIALKAPIVDAGRANHLMKAVTDELARVGEDLPDLELWVIDGKDLTNHDVGGLSGK